MKASLGASAQPIIVFSLLWRPAVHQTVAAQSSMGPGAKVIGAEAPAHSVRQGEEVTSAFGQWLLRLGTCFICPSNVFYSDLMDLPWHQRVYFQWVRVHGTKAWSILGIEVTVSENKTMLFQQLAQTEQQHQQQGK